MEQVDTKSYEDATRKTYESNAAIITVELAEYHLNHLKRLYRAFNGDLLLPLILGEVGHFNLRGLDVSSVRNPLFENMHALVKTRQACNTYSISLSLGLPRETVRRKAAKLIDMGFLQRSGGRNLYITNRAVQEFVPEFNLETFRLFLGASQRISRITRGPNQ